MNFVTFDEFYLWLNKNRIYYFDEGAQGTCYKIGNKIYKIFNQFVDEFDETYSDYTKEDILRFSFVKNNIYVWPIDIISVGNNVIGYVMNYVDAKSLYKTNPLLISLDKFESSLDCVDNSIRTISNNGILSYDVCYNIMYGRNGFKIIDTLEYSDSSEDEEMLYVKNKNNFSYGVKLFLVDSLFNSVVEDSKILSEMYRDVNVSAIEFLRVFRNRLSEIEGFEVLKLAHAKRSLCKEIKTPKYIRFY